MIAHRMDRLVVICALLMSATPCLSEDRGPAPTPPATNERSSAVSTDATTSTQIPPEVEAKLKQLGITREEYLRAAQEWSKKSPAERAREMQAEADRFLLENRPGAPKGFKVIPQPDVTNNNTMVMEDDLRIFLSGDTLWLSNKSGGYSPIANVESLTGQALAEWSWFSLLAYNSLDRSAVTILGMPQTPPGPGELQMITPDKIATYKLVSVDVDNPKPKTILSIDAKQLTPVWMYCRKGDVSLVLRPVNGGATQLGIVHRGKQTLELKPFPAPKGQLPVAFTYSEKLDTLVFATNEKGSGRQVTRVWGTVPDGGDSVELFNTREADAVTSYFAGIRSLNVSKDGTMLTLLGYSDGGAKCAILEKSIAPKAASLRVVYSGDSKWMPTAIVCRTGGEIFVHGQIQSPAFPEQPLLTGEQRFNSLQVGILRLDVGNSRP